MATRPKAAPAPTDDAAEEMTFENPPRGVRVGTPAPAWNPPADFLDDEETPADRVAALLGDIRGDSGAVVKLYRTKSTGKQGGGVEWCDEMTPAEFEAQGIAGIRDKWGPGEYEVRLYAPLPDTGRFSMRAKQRLQIAAPAGGVAAIAAPVNSEMAQALRAMQETQARMLEALTTRPPAPDPMAQLGTMLGLMAQMRAAMGDGGQSKTPLSEMLSAVRELKGIAGELGGEPQDPLMAAIPSLVELIGKTVQAQASAPRLPAPIAPMRVPPTLARPTVAPAPAPVASRVTRPVAPVAAPAVGPLGTPLAEKPLPGETIINIAPDETPSDLGGVTFPPKTENAQMELPQPADNDPNAQFLYMLESVCEQLERGDEIGDVADYVWENLPDELMPLIGTPGWFDLFVNVIRGVSPAHADKLVSMRDKIELVGQEVVEIRREEAEADGAGDVANPAV